MRVEQFVMAYGVDQDRIRAFLPEGFESLRPVLRINVEIRKLGMEKEQIYIEFNVPVKAQGRTGWLNIENWETPSIEISYEKRGKATTFTSDFLTITYTGVGVEGGCPAEKDNEGCFYLKDGSINHKKENTDFTLMKYFVPTEKLEVRREFCDCEFQWNFPSGKAHGKSQGEKSQAAPFEEIKGIYKKERMSPEHAASIECKAILGSYRIAFDRK